MIVYLNGQFVPAEKAKVSVFDRGFLYGDALFETIRIHKGRPFQWATHAARLQAGAQSLAIPLPPVDELAQAAMELCVRNNTTDAILRINVSRGQGQRGYSPREAGPATIVLSLHPAPPLAPDPAPWRLVTSTVSLFGSPTAVPTKHSNKLPNIIARAEADRHGADEALMLDSEGFAVEGSCSNLFWIREGLIFTPPAKHGVLAGITRGFVLDWCWRNKVAVQEDRRRPHELREQDAVFLTLSTWGIAEAVELDGTRLPGSPLVRRIYHAWLEALQSAEP